jgi:hypothetical protein
MKSEHFSFCEEEGNTLSKIEQTHRHFEKFKCTVLFLLHIPSFLTLLICNYAIFWQHHVLLTYISVVP